MALRKFRSCFLVVSLGKVLSKISVDSSQEPADVVEEFAYRAVAKGRHIGFEEMKQLMEYFCTR